LGRGRLKNFYQSHLYRVLAAADRPEIPAQPAANLWNPAIRELLREVPVLASEPADPKTLIDRTVWRLFSEDQQWWRGRVYGYTTHTKALELWPMYKVGACVSMPLDAYGGCCPWTIPIDPESNCALSEDCGLGCRWCTPRLPQG
jgi:hypothetical protein